MADEASADLYQTYEVPFPDLISLAEDSDAIFVGRIEGVRRAAFTEKPSSEDPGGPLLQYDAIVFVVEESVKGDVEREVMLLQPSAILFGSKVTPIVTEPASSLRDTDLDTESARFLVFGRADGLLGDNSFVFVGRDSLVEIDEAGLVASMSEGPFRSPRGGTNLYGEDFSISNIREWVERGAMPPIEIPERARPRADERPADFYNPVDDGILPPQESLEFEK